jgi:serine/threonine protein kinase/WD40 repeat protein
MNTENLNMKPDAKRVAALFQAALQLTGNARASFLENACAGDIVLRQRLEALLAADEQSNGVLGEPAPAVRGTMKIGFAEVPDETIGQKIGHYKILEKVGEGGCGVVYVAEQTEPVRRRVALKVIKLGMDTKQVVARFEAERQALAMMDHPNIAKVLDAGATETGRPYFIMELVRGIRITDYCDQNNLSTKERLDLFIKVCQAIQHAHQKGIIHRDIKPSNILVTLHDGVPVPKVIDFGIAKATTDQRLTDKTIYTQLQQFVGTPAYMSPEQAEMSGLDIDTRCDIYGLGVLLYELLTGRTPFDTQELMSQGIDAMRKTIREREPARPSTKLATLKGDELTTTAKRRSIESSRLANLLRGDLDWIVMKCLEKDRTRRYETANGLAFDLKRHLNNETVLARPPSSTYRFQRMVRRNKLTFAAIGAVAVALVLGILATTWQAIQATHAKEAALAAQASEKIQRQQAMANEKEAVAAQKAEATEELAARQRAYASDMNLAGQALKGSNLGWALDLLNRQRPRPGQKDLRGWEWRYLWQQTRSDALLTLGQASSEIESLAVSADGRWLAAGVDHKDGVFVYDLQTRQQVADLAHGENELHVAFSPAQPLMAFTSSGYSASGQELDTLHFWNSTTRQIMAEFPLGAKCAGLAFSGDGKMLVTSTGKEITLWRVPEGTRLASYPSWQLAEVDPTDGFAATSDLSLAAYGDNSGWVHVVDLRSGKELWSANASTLLVTALAFSPDGRTLASAGGFDESDIRLWNVATGSEIGRLEGHQTWVGSLVFWPDGKKMASCSADQTIRTWDVASRKCLDVLRGHRLDVWRLALLPDNKTLVSGSKDGTVCFWDTSVTHSHQPSIVFPETAAHCFAPDSSLVILNWQGQVARWSGPDFQQKESLLEIGITNLGPFPGAAHFLFSRDGRFLAVGYADGSISVWNVSQGSLLGKYKPGTGPALPQAFLADGNRLICWKSDDNHFSEWDLKENREIQSWPAPVEFQRDGPSRINVSPDERLGIAVGWHGAVSGRNLAEQTNTNLPLDVLEGWSGAFSADARWLVDSSALGYARVWDTSTWQEEVTLHGFVVSAGFSPDGRRLATGGFNGDGAVTLWDADSWQNLTTLKSAPGQFFFFCVFSPDGNAIATVSNPGNLNIWRAPSWAEINAAEAKDPPSPEYGSAGNAETQQP